MRPIVYDRGSSDHSAELLMAVLRVLPFALLPYVVVLSQRVGIVWVSVRCPVCVVAPGSDGHVDFCIRTDSPRRRVTRTTVNTVFDENLCDPLSDCGSTSVLHYSAMRSV